MTEMYVAVRDGMGAANIGAGVWKVSGRYELPWYTQGEARTKTGEDLYRDFESLVRPREEVH